MVGYALTVSGVITSLVAFGLAGSVIVLLMFGLALAVGTAQDGLIARLRTETAQVKRWGGIILLIAGFWISSLGIFATYFARIFPV